MTSHFLDHPPLPNFYTMEHHRTEPGNLFILFISFILYISSHCWERPRSTTGERDDKGLPEGARPPLAQDLESTELRMDRTCFPGIYPPLPRVQAIWYIGVKRNCSLKWLDLQFPVRSISDNHPSRRLAGKRMTLRSLGHRQDRG